MNARGNNSKSAAASHVYGGVLGTTQYTFPAASNIHATLGQTHISSSLRRRITYSTPLLPDTGLQGCVLVHAAARLKCMPHVWVGFLWHRQTDTQRIIWFHRKREKTTWSFILQPAHRSRFNALLTWSLCAHAAPEATAIKPDRD